MILYNDDLYTTKCTIDYSTKNKSFLKMSMLLKKMGVVNHNFMLALTQPELQGVDPHDPDLTEEIKLRIAYECKVNAWYFFREVIRISSQGGDMVRFRLDRANLALIWCFLNNQDAFLTMPRQIGKTVGVLSISVYSLYILSRNTNQAMLAKDATLRAENVDRMKDMRDGLPKYLFQSGPKHNNDNQETVVYKPNNAKYLTFVAQTSQLSAGKQGKGHSFIWSHWDELAFYSNAQLSFESATSASNTAREQAEANGIPCATLITTTAGPTGNKDGKFAYSLAMGALRFNEKLYDCKDVEELRKMVELGSSGDNGFIYIEYNYKQLGKDEKWFKKVTRNKSPEIIATEFLNKWINGSGLNIIPKHMVDKLENGVEEPVSVTIEDSLILRWYADQDTLKRDEFKNIPFILCSDTSDNVGQDFTTLVMINPRDMAVVMTCRCNQTNMVQVANTIFTLLERFPKSVFIPERNRAATLLDILVHLIEQNTKWNVFARIYNSYVQDKGETTNFRKLDTRLGTTRKQFGFKTGSNSRTFLYSTVLMDVIERNHDRIFDKSIVEEMCGLVVRNGRVDHVLSGHDDSLVAYLIGCWFIMYGKHMYLYGIDKSDIMVSGNSETDDTSIRTEDTIARINELTEMLDSGRVTEMIRRGFENELRDLKASIDEKDIINNDAFTMNQVDNHKSKQVVVDIGELQSLLTSIYR